MMTKPACAWARPCAAACRAIARFARPNRNAHARHKNESVAGDLHAQAIRESRPGMRARQPVRQREVMQKALAATTWTQAASARRALRWPQPA
jgi:hypothetical protein